MDALSAIPPYRILPVSDEREVHAVTRVEGPDPVAAHAIDGLLIGAVTLPPPSPHPRPPAEPAVQVHLHEPEGSQFRRVLVPVDYSPCARTALGHALRLARTFGAAVDVLHIAPAHHDPERQAAAMTEFLAPVRTTVLVGRRLETGDACEGILRAAAEGYDLIVMGTHGRSGIAHLLLGSVAERIVRAAPCPVLTVRAPDEPA